MSRDEAGDVMADRSIWAAVADYLRVHTKV